MSKALQKHMVSHLPEGAEGDGGDTTAKAQLRKDDGKNTFHVTDVLSFNMALGWLDGRPLWSILKYINNC